MKLKEIPASLYFSFYLRYVKGARNPKKKLPVLVSLTTIPSRLPILDIAIKSLIHQQQPPEKIILWLNENCKDKIGKRLKNLEGDHFSIRFSSLDCPHLKLVESLKSYPEKVIVTADDDFIYAKDWTKQLYDGHLHYPNAIIANQVRQIRTDENGVLLPYKKWSHVAGENPKASLAIGSSGVLYPPGSLHEMTTDEKVFLELTPRTDDLWFKAMALLKGTEVKKVRKPPREPLPIAGSQGISLKKENIDRNKNVAVWEKLVAYFNLDYGQG